MTLKPSIRTRIIGAIVIGVGLMAALLALALYEHVQITRNMDAVEAVVEDIEQSAHLQSAVSRMLMPANDYLITGKPDEKLKFKQLDGEVELLLNKLDALAKLDPEKRANLAQVREDYQRLKGMGEEILALPNPVGDVGGADLMKRFDDHGDEIVRSLYHFHLMDEI